MDINKIQRVYVEKKLGFNIEAQKMLKNIDYSLGISLDSLKIVHCYDVQGLSYKHLEVCKTSVFAEVNLDMLLSDLPSGDFVLGKRLLPGQYDQRADSAAQCVQILTGTLPDIVYTKYFVFYGKLSEENKKDLEGFIINPIDSMIAEVNIPKSLNLDIKEPEDIKSLSITQLNRAEIEELHKSLSLAMSLEDMLFVQDYFKNIEKREPTITEVKVIDTYWSDHCRHTTFLTTIDDVTFEDGGHHELLKSTHEEYISIHKNLYKNNRPINLMGLATIAMKHLSKTGELKNLDKSEEINAASIVIPVDVDGKQEEWLLMFKNETHNHPTEMEPYGGAATCLGGAIRDPLSGRAYVYQAMRVTGAADPKTPIENTIKGKLPQKTITTVAAEGYSSYGNQMGLATGLVAEIYHPGFVAKRMEVGAVIAAVKKENVIRKKPKNGDVVILVGGRTGKDGVGGATGSSKDHSESSLAISGAEVQKGNPPTERKLMRLFRSPEATRLILRCNDFGAGGIAVAIGELADSLEINLDDVRKKYDGLDATDIALSESQERMAVVVAKENVQGFISLAFEENLEAYEVAKVTNTNRLVMKHKGKEIVNISREFLDTSGVMQHARVYVAKPKNWDIPAKKSKNLEEAWLSNLASPNVCSQKGLIEMFDYTVGANTLLAPLGGKHQLTPALAMAARIPLSKGKTQTASVMSYGYNPYITEASPFHGALYAVVDSVSKLVATGVNPKDIYLSFQEYFEKLTDSTSWGKPYVALLGAFLAQIRLSIAAIGGKDSMSGTFKDGKHLINVPPTLISFAVGYTKEQFIISPEFKKTDSYIVLLSTVLSENGVPNFEHLKQNYDIIYKLICQNDILAAHTVDNGGISAAISKMAFGNNIGVKINYDSDLFAYNTGMFILETSKNPNELFFDIPFTILGRTAKQAQLDINGNILQLKKCIDAWQSTLEPIFPSVDNIKNNIKNIDYTPKKAERTAFSKEKFARPRVLIPVFPGSNSEWDLQRKFEDAGALVDIFIINNITSDSLKESITRLAKKINQAQIISIPGGFSAGDEPEGSGKFIAAVFKSPQVMEATMQLIDDRLGLMLGVCNGFQALIKLGLLPYGKIYNQTENAPTLTYNNIGKHMSSIVKTRIISKVSPWFSACQIGDIYNIPASHGEGKIVANESELTSLFENGQVASQYVMPNGDVALDMPHNPNGSVCGIEAITSKDGRILGKMCHSERIGGLYKNVKGNYDQQIFVSSVKYYN